MVKRYQIYLTCLLELVLELLPPLLAHDEMSAGELKTYWSKDYLDRIMETSFLDQASLIQARPRYETKGE